MCINTAAVSNKFTLLEQPKSLSQASDSLDVIQTKQILCRLRGGFNTGLSSRRRLMMQGMGLESDIN